MNKEKLNEIMNCGCLQSIIENDKKKHTMNVERFGEKIFQTPNDCSEIIFECFTSYRNKYIDSRNYVIKDRTEKDYCGVPFLYCPICGTKSKHNTPEDIYYHQFQNNR